MNSRPTGAVASAATATLALVMCASSFLFVFGMPWVEAGLWPEQETTVSALHAVTAAAALLLGLLAAIGDRRTIGAVTSKPVLLLAAFGVLGLLLAPLSVDPWRSVHGALKHGVGALWHLELAVLAAAASVILRSAWKKPFLAVLAAASLTAAATYLYPAKAGVPLSFPEWAGMFTGAAALALLLATRGGAWMAAGLALAVAGYLISGNRAVLVTGVAAAAAYAAVAYGPRFGFRLLRSKKAAFLPAAIAVIGAVSVLASSAVIEAVKTPDAPVSSRVLSEDPRDHVRLSDGPLGTIWSRSWMARVGYLYATGNPSVLVHGSGWGSFPEAYERHAREVPGRKYASSQPGASFTYWDTHSKSTFHSHNVTVETLVSTGAAGVLLWLAFLTALAASSRRGLIAATALAVMSTFWFPVVHMTAAIAALVAAGASPGRPSRRTAGVLAAMAPAPGIILAGLLAFASFLTAGLARTETAQIRFEGTYGNQDVRTCEAITAKFLPEIESNVYVYRVLVNRAFRSSDPAAYLFDNSQHAVLMACTMRRYVLEGRGGLRPFAESLEARERLARLGTPAWGIIAEDLIGWGDDVRAFLAIAPGRTEIIVPYILHLRDRHPETMLAEALDFADVLEDGDPVKYFILSVLAEHRGQGETARQHMRRAFARGYADVAPVSQAMIESVMAP